MSTMQEEKKLTICFLQVQNLVLEVLLASLMSSDSVRITVSVSCVSLYDLSLICYVAANVCLKISNSGGNTFILQEISLGILGNLACHDVPMNHIISTEKLLETIVDQVFSDDAPCLCEVCR